MSIVHVIRLIYRNLKWLLSLPIITGIVVFLLTGNLPKQYTSSTTVYTGLASGYDITETGNSKLDRNAVNNAFDNLITTINSRQTTEEVALQLLTQHLLLEEPNLLFLAKAGFLDLQSKIPDSLKKNIVVKDDFDKTFTNLTNYKNSSIKNEVRSLIEAGSGFYSIKQISGNLKPKRFSNSDMVQIDFTSSDAGVAKNTLVFMVETFMKRYNNLKGGETSNVVAYFEKQLAQAQGKLDNAEGNLKSFGIDNRIINYEMQTKYIAEYKERLESELYKHRMQMEAAKAAILRLENDLEHLAVKLKNNKTLNSKRVEYSNVNKLLSNGQLYGIDPAKLDSLTTEKIRIENELKQVVTQFHNYKHSIQGIETKKVLDQWLVKLIEFEEYQASLEVFTQRKKEFDEIYDEFAPLGSTLNKLNRKVDILEQQYLSILHGLNMAKLKQQSIELANGIQIMDDPFFPVHAAASKRMLLVIASAISVGFLLLVLVFLRAFLDASIKTPQRASILSNVPLAGAVALDNIRTRKAIKLYETQHSLIEQLISTISIHLSNNKENASQKIVIYSLRANEGKSFVAEKLLERLTSINGKAVLYSPEKGTHNIQVEPKDIELISYPVPENLIKVEQASELSNKEPSSRPITLIELPRINKYSIPSALVKNADLSLLIVNAKRNWSVADDHLQELYLKAVDHPVMVVINKTEADDLESILGELPKNRSIARRWIKKLISLNFNKT